MRIYELTFILNASLDDNAVQAEIQKLTDQITVAGGKVFEVQHLGKKNMCYEIKDQRQGNYITIYYQADSDLPKKLEGNMKLNESILRCLTIVLSPSEYQPPVKEEEKPEASPTEEVS